MSKQKHKVKWLGRHLAAPGPYLSLCLSEEEFKVAMADLKIEGPPPWITTPQANATAHFCNNGHDGRLAAVVCMRGAEKRDPVEVAGLLVHEAVHVWQEYAEHIGERSPGAEQEAYAIQAISQELMADYAKRINK